MVFNAIYTSEILASPEASHALFEPIVKLRFLDPDTAHNWVLSIVAVWKECPELVSERVIESTPQIRQETAFYKQQKVDLISGTPISTLL